MDSSSHVGSLHNGIPGASEVEGSMPATDVPSETANGKKKSRTSREMASVKRRCVSTACVACRRRKSKCDGNTPSCAACSSVYGTECVYDPNSDHRRKGVYREKIDSLKTRNSTLQTLIQAILNANEDDVPALVRAIRTCESLDDVAEKILNEEYGMEASEDEGELVANNSNLSGAHTFETELSGKMGELRVENGSVRFIGGTSNLIYLSPADSDGPTDLTETIQQQEEPLTTWTTVTTDTELVVHLINMYFTWHYPYFTTLSKSLFYRDFLLGKQPGTSRQTVYCSSLLVNAMLALGCHFTNSPLACADVDDPATKGDAFFAEAKRLIIDNDEYEKPKLSTIQALCLMSVREAGCGREAKGWVYSGMSFRMAQDMGLNLDSGGMTNNREPLDEEEIDARRVTFWGCFLFDKCWSNYLGRLPQLPASNITAPKYDVFPSEDSEVWSPYTDIGLGQLQPQPSRTRAIALQISSLCEISSDLLIFFYHPNQLERSAGKAQEVKKLSELHTRLEAWRKELPKEMEPKEGQLPNILLMHMFFNLLYIHLFRPFLKYSPTSSPLPPHVSPRKICIHAGSSISKLMRLYKRIYGLRQICNIAVYMVHSACTIHLLNLPDKAAKRDIIHGVKNLEEIAENWLCARRTLSILSVLSQKWGIDLPEEASNVLARTGARFGVFHTSDIPSPKGDHITPAVLSSGKRQIQKGSPAQPLAYYVPQQNMLGSSSVSGDMGYRNGLSSPVILPPSASNNIVSPPMTKTGSERNSSNINMQQLAQAYSQSLRIPNNSLRVSQSTSGSISRQMSPTTLFGGVDALVESQDWWLRDQATLAVEFSSWAGDITSDLRDRNLEDSTNGTSRTFTFGDGEVSGEMESLRINWH